MFRKIILVVAFIAGPAWSEDRSFDLQVPDILIESGFIKHLLPRFSLKTGIRITPVSESADADFGADGVAVFRQGEKIWHLEKVDGVYTDRFAQWLLSDIGKRTIEGFTQDGEPPFFADVGVALEAQIITITGDAGQGEVVSLKKCGRCHVINASNRMKAIGSTPSFALMRTFPDWKNRFEAFFTLNPHPAFTQVKDVTEPFSAKLPSPIVPVEVTLYDIEAILSYVACIFPASLFSPMHSQ